MMITRVVIPTLAMLFCALAFGSWTSAEESQLDDPLTAEMTALLTEQVDYWNAGDLDGFMRYYWNSDQLTFSSGGSTRRGWDETLRRYRERYPTPERMGKTTFSDIEARPLGDSAALVLGRWSLERQPDPIGGNFSLVLQKTDGRWVIVHDHTSQSPEEVPAE